MNNNLCGESTGEALSRWCAAQVSNNALSDFASATARVSAGMPDFISRTGDTDRNPVSVGAGMAYLSWLISQGHALDQIAPIMVSLKDAGTLAQLSAKLTRDHAGNAFPKVLGAVQALPGGVQSDDPFGGGGAGPSAQLGAGSIATAAEILAVILGDLAAGKSAAQIVADVLGILEKTAANVKAHSNGQGKACSIRSHRLRLPSKN